LGAELIILVAEEGTEDILRRTYCLQRAKKSLFVRLFTPGTFKWGCVRFLF